jgi:hypothetical protein
MKTKVNFALGKKRGSHFGMALVVTGLCLTTAGSQAVGEPTNFTTSTYGSGKLYKTTVERQSQGNLSTEDLDQASLLTSEFLTHVNQAAQQLADGRVDNARAEIDKAQLLMKVVRGLLPTTIVTTSVKDVQGEEIYHDEQRVQEDQIPISAGDVAVEVVEPIVEAKKDQAALKGVKLANAELVHTAVLVDLGYAERKLKRAIELMSKPQEAASELALIQSDGVHFFAHKEDSPLVEVQHALRLAERMVREKKYDSASANLQTAKLQLEAYRELVDERAGQAVNNLEKDIERLSGEMQTTGAADKIRGMWDEVASWFKRESGQAHRSTNSTPQATSSNSVQQISSSN